MIREPFLYNTDQCRYDEFLVTFFGDFIIEYDEILWFRPQDKTAFPMELDVSDLIHMFKVEGYPMTALERLEKGEGLWFHKVTLVGLSGTNPNGRACLAGERVITPSGIEVIRAKFTVQD